MFIVKSHLRKLRNHVTLGPPTTPEQPLTNEEDISTPYIPVGLPSPPAVVYLNEWGNKAWTKQIVRERTWNPDRFPLPGTSSPKPPRPLDISLNYRLPFDILVQIFEQFARIEGRTSPLERILEVCHFWRDTALDHKTLWTTFRMVVTDYLEVDYWRKRFPQRANRFGTDALLDISIELVNRPVKLITLPCGTYEVEESGRRTHTHAYHTLRLLKVVGGKRGTTAVRWRSLSLNVLHLGNLMSQDDGIIDRFLQFRTPNLESLELYGVVTPFRQHKRIFPYTPRLRRAVFHSCQLSHYPDTSTLTSLAWYSIQDIPFYPQRNRNIPAIRAITAAQKITYLEIGLDWTYWDTPMIFQRVKTLKMTGKLYPELLIMIQAPSLRHLTIGLDREAKFGYLKDCKGIPIAQVETLEIFYRPPDEDIEEADAATVEGLGVLLTQMINLRVLYWDKNMATRKDLLKSVLELFTSGSVAEDVLQGAGSITKREG